MDPLERASRLKQEADSILQQIGLCDVLIKYGRVVPTGSYFLDVMMYPDIDLYISKVSIKQLFEIGAQLAESDQVCQVVFERSRTSQLPGGLYLKLRVDQGAWGRWWKIDIWSLDDAIIDEKMEDMHHFRQSMTDHLRGQILRYKHSILTAEGRTPKYSGYFIYRAFVDEGLYEFEDVTRYLVEHGVQVG